MNLQLGRHCLKDQQGTLCCGAHCAVGDSVKNDSSVPPPDPERLTR